MNLGMRTAPIVHEHHRARSAAHTVTNKHSSKVMDDRRNPHTHTHHHSNPPRVAPEIRTILPELKDIVYRTSHEQIKTQPHPSLYDAYGKCRQISFSHLRDEGGRQLSLLVL